jgi:hypothetical protein
MNNLKIEHFPSNSNHSTMKDIAKHLYTRMHSGKVVIVVENPQISLPTLRRQWIKLIRKIENQRSSTLNTSRIIELTANLTRMNSLKFSTNYAQDDTLADVTITTIDKLLLWPPECHTLYVRCEVELKVVYLVTGFMGEGGVVVLCPNSAYYRNL